MNFGRFETYLNRFRNKSKVKRKRVLCQHATLGLWLPPSLANGPARPRLVAHYEEIGEARHKGGAVVIAGVPGARAGGVAHRLEHYKRAVT
jgi:hypothetical protein